jgi:hypothetical protein
MGTSDREIEITCTEQRYRHSSTASWKIPYCNACISHAKQHSASDSNKAGVVFLALIFGCYVGYTFSVWLGVLVALGLAIALPLLWEMFFGKQIDSQLKPSCSTKSYAVEFKSFHGYSMDFVFSNREYLNLFLATNSSKNHSSVRDVF